VSDPGTSSGTVISCRCMKSKSEAAGATSDVSSLGLQ